MKEKNAFWGDRNLLGFRRRRRRHHHHHHHQAV